MPKIARTGHALKHVRDFASPYSAYAAAVAAKNDLELSSQLNDGDAKRPLLRRSSSLPDLEQYLTRSRRRRLRGRARSGSKKNTIDGEEDTAASAEDDDAADEDGLDTESSPGDSHNDEVLSRQQRRRRAKRKSYYNRLELINVHNALQRRIERRKELGALGDFRALNDALTLIEAESDSPPNAESFSARNRGTTATFKSAAVLPPRRDRPQIANAEFNRLRQILNMPEFDANPVGAVAAHLQNVMRMQQAKN